MIKEDFNKILSEILKNKENDIIERQNKEYAYKRILLAVNNVYLDFIKKFRQLSNKELNNEIYKINDIFEKIITYCYLECRIFNSISEGDTVMLIQYINSINTDINTLIKFRINTQYGIFSQFGETNESLLSEFKEELPNL